MDTLREWSADDGTVIHEKDIQALVALCLDPGQTNAHSGYALRYLAINAARRVNAQINRG